MFNIILRGGRLTKYNGKAASYAPGSGVSSPDVATSSTFAPVLGRMASALGASVSARALATRVLAVAFATAAPLALTVTGANAGVCTETFVGSGIFVCAGPAAGGDVTQTLAPPVGGALDVSTLPGFGITAAGDAITLTNTAAETDITFTDNNISAITGSNVGIEVDAFGTGFTSITTTGAVTGTTSIGIDVNVNNATSLTINAQGAVSGGINGIEARNSFTGAVSITTQAVTGTGNIGIYAFNSGTDLTINAQGAVQGGRYGVFANQDGSGALSITTQAVTGTTVDGIFADNSVNGTSLTINAQGAVIGGEDGIDALNAGTGALSITTQAVTGAVDAGINANNSAAGTSLTITTQGMVQGNDDGIRARNYGTGALSITTQAVTSNTDDGIDARNNYTSLTIDAQGLVQGADIGIRARNFGSGALSITTQAVTGGTGEGVYARNDGTSLTINAQGAVAGGSDGIDARNNGTGALSITTTGTITGGNDGIFANNSAAGTSLTITALGTVMGGDEGIRAINNGTGALSITTQAVTATVDDGIDANNSAAGTSLTINTQGVVIGGDDGIQAINDGSGAVSITTGAVRGVLDNGIFARNNNGTSITINAQGAVSGATEGIDALNYGSGAVSITSQAVTSATLSGIAASNSAAGTSITINAQGPVTGNPFGIFANNDGTGATTITTSGGVTGNVGITVAVRTNNSPATINNSSVITGTGGVAINFQGDGNDTLNLNGGSVINGTIDFGNGNNGLGGTNANDIDTLNVGPGVNAVLTFADAGGAGQGDNALQSAPENITGNVALINGGTQAVAVDPTGFAAVSVALGSLISSIFNSIDNNGSAQPWDVSPAGGSGITPAGGDVAYGAGRRLWVSGFGGKQKVEGSSNQAGIDNRFGGGITGVESGSGGSTYGVFGGYAVSELDLEFNAGDVEFDSAFGGAYWKINTGTFSVNLALVAGSADQDTTRNVGGVNARGESDGWFFSPSITLAAPMEFYAQPVIFSGRVSYAGLFLDGYTETGVANPLTVSDRDVHILNTRAQVNVPFNVAGKDGSRTQLDVRAGVDAQFDAGSDDAALVVGGTALNFSADLDNEIAGFVGTTLSYTSASGIFSFSASGEVQSTFDGGYKAIGQVRGAVRF